MSFEAVEPPLVLLPGRAVRCCQCEKTDLLIAVALDQVEDVLRQAFGNALLVRRELGFGFVGAVVTRKTRKGRRGR